MHIQAPSLQLELRGEGCDSLANNLTPSVGQTPFGNFGCDVGLREEILEDIAYKHCLCASHTQSRFNFAALDTEQGVLLAGTFKRGLQAVFIAVGDKNLAKIVARHQREQLLDTSHVEFIEQIVE